METIEQVLDWAEDHVRDLRKEMRWKPRESVYGGYWQAVDPQAKGRIRARATAALGFLERFTGTGSRWSKNAQDVFERGGERQSMESGAHAVGDMLKEWIRLVRSGQVKPRLESLSARAVSSTDLLEQVRALNADRAVIPAAPIVLAGAALEIALRSAVEELGLTITRRPSIDAYAHALRRAEVLNKQDIKNVTHMAGLRNEAAHGMHDALGREGAVLMEQQVNLFLARLDEAVRQSI